MSLQDNSCGRHFIIGNGRISSASVMHAHPDLDLFFASAQVALEMLMPPRDQLKIVNAIKAFQLGIHGRDDLACW